MRISVLVAATLLAAAPAFAADPSAEDFLSKQIKAGNGLVELGGLAAKKGARPEVRRFGETLASDATHRRAQDADLARKLGLEVPDGLGEDGEIQTKTLRELDGRAFDQAFARYVLYDRRRDLERLQTEAKAGAPLVANLARAELPLARRDLERARALDHAVGNE